MLQLADMCNIFWIWEKWVPEVARLSDENNCEANQNRGKPRYLMLNEHRKHIIVGAVDDIKRVPAFRKKWHRNCGQHRCQQMDHGAYFHCKG